ncbi:MAG: helix-turn-helix domain-containing protein [Mycobacteriales bacterium]
MTVRGTSARLSVELRRLRELSGLSLRSLERKVHVSDSSLSRYLAGQSVPPWSVVVALCQLAGRDPEPLRDLWERARLHRKDGVAAHRDGLCPSCHRPLPETTPTGRRRRQG